MRAWSARVKGKKADRRARTIRRGQMTSAAAPGEHYVPKNENADAADADHDTTNQGGGDGAAGSVVVSFPT